MSFKEGNDKGVSHFVGYRGYCKISAGGESDKTCQLLCTGGNINLTQQPIMSTGVWGANYKMAGPALWAWNYLNLQGSVNFQRTKRQKQWDALVGIGQEDRTSQDNTITLYPDGINGFSGAGWLTSLSFECSQGAVASGSFNFKGDPFPSSENANTLNSSAIVAGSSWGTDDTAKASLSSGYGKPEGLTGAELIAYWNTGVVGITGIGNQFTSWNMSYNSDVQMLKCCNVSMTYAKRADYAIFGQMSGELGFTVFGIKGNFSPSKYQKTYQNAGVVMNGNQVVRFGYLIQNSASTSMQTGSSYTTAQFSYTAVVGGDPKSDIYFIKFEGYTGQGGGTGGDGTGGDDTGGGGIGN